MTTQFVGESQTFPNTLFDFGTTQMMTLGSKASTNDGRSYRYTAVQAASGGATGQPTGATLVVGNLLQGPAQIANHIALTPAAASIGDTTITATLGATAAYANQYANGLVFVSTTPGNGYAYRIKSHAAVASAGVITLVLEDAIQVALTTSSRLDLQQNAYANALQTPTTLTGAVIGVAVSAITASTSGVQTFGWIQTKGPSATLVQSTPAVGAAVMPSGTTAGAVTTQTAGNLIVGSMMSTGVNGKNNGVLLCIDG